MYFDFCINEAPAQTAALTVNVIFNICGDHSYQTPRKPVTPGRTYFVYTTLGCGLIEYDGRTFEVGQGDFIFMRPHENFSYRCKDNTWNFWWFEFEAATFLQEDKICNLTANDFTLSLFAQSLAFAKAGRWDISAMLFCSAATILQHLLPLKGASKYAAEIQQAEQYIRENMQTVTVGELCAFLKMNERTVRNLFYRTVGLAPKQVITKMRLNLAQQLLENSLLSIEEIAARLGFSSQFHLSSSFKERFGIPPLKYRKFFHCQ